MVKRVLELFLCVCFFPVNYALSGIIALGAEVRMLAEGFVFTEGPASDKAGNVYFTDLPNDRIMKWTVEGKLETFMQPSGRSNGMCFDGEGNLWACADEKNQLWRIDPAGKCEVVVSDYEGKLLNAPNDVWIRPDGGMYFTDPFYERDYWKRGPMEQDGQNVYFLSPDHRKLTCVATGFAAPNGIIGTPDGKFLYVADLGAGKTYRYAIEEDGSLSQKKLFCEMGSDGMTIDDRGNVYLTGGSVFVFDPQGRQIEKIDMPKPGWCGNVCFGGADKRTLFITANKYLWALDMQVQGVGSQ